MDERKVIELFKLVNKAIDLLNEATSENTKAIEALAVSIKLLNFDKLKDLDSEADNE